MKDDLNNFQQFDTDNCTARCVVVIGGSPTIPISYSLTENNMLESDNCTIDFSSDLLDYSGLLQSARKSNSYVPIEIWVGYENIQERYHAFNESMTGHKSNDVLKRTLVNGEYKDRLHLRWQGLVDQPTFKIGGADSNDTISLVCRERIVILQEFPFEKKYEGSHATVKSVITDLQQQIKDFTILIDPELEKNSARMNLLLGQKDTINKDNEETEKISDYNTKGKTFWEVILDICSKAKITFLQSDTDPNTYIFKELMTSPYLWVLDRGKHFKDCDIKMGKFSGNQGGKIGIIVKSKQKNGSVIIGKFPRDLSNASPESHKITLLDNVKTDMTKIECEQLAADEAGQIAKSSITGTMHCPNAIAGMGSDHLLNFTDNSGVISIRKMNNILGKDKVNFRITSITENFGTSTGWSQPSVEFEMDISTNLIDSKTGELKAYDLFPNSKDRANIEGVNGQIILYIPKDALPDSLQNMREQ